MVGLAHRCDPLRLREAAAVDDVRLQYRDRTVFEKLVERPTQAEALTGRDWYPRSTRELTHCAWPFRWARFLKEPWPVRLEHTEVLNGHLR